ncbi:MAG: hypothetical protein EP329_09985 [Deltaproteobacteria bacterium]|nr:MAG: hypothetical protein EP329_09985 [Deltaproteobacteria bacterium]
MKFTKHGTRVSRALIDVIAAAVADGATPEDLREAVAMAVALVVRDEDELDRVMMMVDELRTLHLALRTGGFPVWVRRGEA